MNPLLISPETSTSNPYAIHTGAPVDNTGRMMTKRVPPSERSTLTLSFNATDANAMRAFINSIRLKGDKAPSQSLIARRAVHLYLHRLEMLRKEAPAAFATEIQALDAMVTPVPQPAAVSKKTRQ